MPTPTKVQLTGGSFQDSEGNLLVNGYLEMQLSQDGSITGVGQIASGVTIKITLDASGNVAGTQSVWGNDQMSPVNSYYRVTGFTAAGQPAWGPNNQQVNGSGGTFDVGTWVPNQVISWTSPSLPSSGPTLRTDGVDNGSQSILDLDDSMSSGFFWDSGSGKVFLQLQSVFFEQPLTVGNTFLNPFSLGVNSFSITSNVLTLNVFPAALWKQPLRWWLSGFVTGTYLNGVNLILTVTDPVNGVLTAPFTHADVPLTTEGTSAVACMPLHCLANYSGIQIAAPPTYAQPNTPNFTNAGFLWVSPDSDFNVHTIKSSNNLDANLVNVGCFPLLLG